MTRIDSRLDKLEKRVSVGSEYGVIDTDTRRIFYGPRGDVILPEHLPPKIASWTNSDAAEDSDGGRLSRVERATILATLEECGHNKTQTAKKLGISRRALIYKLHEIEADSP